MEDWNWPILSSTNLNIHHWCRANWAWCKRTVWRNCSTRWGHWTLAEITSSAQWTACSFPRDFRYKSALPTCSGMRCTKWISSSIPNWLACTSTTGWPTRPTSKSRTCCPWEKSRTRRDLCWWAKSHGYTYYRLLLRRKPGSRICQNLEHYRNKY